MTIEVIPHPAQKMTIRTRQTIEEWKKFVRMESASKILFGDGTPIRLDKGYQYSFMLMKMTQLLTTEQFFALKPFLDEGIEKAEAAGAIPEGIVKAIGTAFDVPDVPEIPEKFQDELPEGATIQFYFDGDKTCRAELVFPEPEPEED